MTGLALEAHEPVWPKLHPGVDELDDCISSRAGVTKLHPGVDEPRFRSSRAGVAELHPGVDELVCSRAGVTKLHPGVDEQCCLSFPDLCGGGYSKIKRHGIRPKAQQQLDQMQLTPKKIHGDGICQFRSLSWMLYQTQDRYDEIRMQIVDHIATRPEQYAAFRTRSP